MRNIMKFKKRYILLLVIVIAFPFYYNQHGWRLNPWAATRLVWDEANPNHIGQTFTITAPAIYRRIPESLPIPVRKIGITNEISLLKNQIIPNKSVGFFMEIKPSMIFTIEKTYWIRLNWWAKGFSWDYKAAIVSDENKHRYIFYFDDFKYSNRTVLNKVKIEEIKQSFWKFNKIEIAYE